MQGENGKNGHKIVSIGLGSLKGDVTETFQAKDSIFGV